MTTRIVVDLPDHVYRRIESLARQSQRDVNAVVAEVVTRSVQPFPVDANREAMLRETSAFHRLHPSLVKEFAGRYVAILEGQVVDHDTDPVALLQRVRQNYPDQTVLRRKVGPAPESVLHFRSPRLVTVTNCRASPESASPRRCRWRRSGCRPPFPRARA